MLQYYNFNIGILAKNPLLKRIYKSVTKEQIINAITAVKRLTRADPAKYFEEMLDQYARVRRFLPLILQAINFKSTQSGEDIYNAMNFLHSIEGKKKAHINNAPKEIISDGWRYLVLIDQSESKLTYLGQSVCCC